MSYQLKIQFHVRMKAGKRVIHIVVFWIITLHSLVYGYQHSQLHSEEKSINFCKLIFGKIELLETCKRKNNNIDREVECG
jgi:hypothetical protein